MCKLNRARLYGDTSRQVFEFPAQRKDGSQFEAEASYEFWTVDSE